MRTAAPCGLAEAEAARLTHPLRQALVTVTSDVVASLVAVSVGLVPGFLVAAFAIDEGRGAGQASPSRTTTDIAEPITDESEENR